MLKYVWKIVAIMLPVLVAAAVLTACGMKNKHVENGGDIVRYESPVQLPEESGVMLLDCFETVRGAEEDRGYEELVLYTTDDPSVLLLERYAADADGEQTLTKYHVSCHAAELCYTIMENYDMRHWEEMDDTVSLDGVLKSCKFYDNGTYVRVSTEQMPEDGENALAEIRLTLGDYMTEENLIGE